MLELCVGEYCGPPNRPPKPKATRSLVLPHSAPFEDHVFGALTGVGPSLLNSCAPAKRLLSTLYNTYGKPTIVGLSLFCGSIVANVSLWFPFNPTPTNGIHFAPPQKPWNDDSPANTNKNRQFPVLRGGEMDFDGC